MKRKVIRTRWLEYKIHHSGVRLKNYAQNYFGVVNYNGNRNDLTPNSREHRYNYAMQVSTLYQAGVYWWWNRRGELSPTIIYKK